jgi:putative colanic acid biosynthesis acetyltransferase WcaF
MSQQNLSAFRLPAGFRGRSAWFVQLWWLVQATLFRHSPQFAYGFRAWLLRRFGAQVGVNTVIRPTVTVTYPWKVKIGDFAWIGDDVVLYSLGEIEIGADSVVSQRSYLCAGDHDYRDSTFPIRGRRIVVEAQSWIAADVFIAPGVVVGHGAVIGARSSVFHDMPSGMVSMGNPCRPLKPRKIS